MSSKRGRKCIECWSLRTSSSQPPPDADGLGSCNTPHLAPWDGMLHSSSVGRACLELCALQLGGGDPRIPCVQLPKPATRFHPTNRLTHSPHCRNEQFWTRQRQVAARRRFLSSQAASKPAPRTPRKSACPPKRPKRAGKKRQENDLHFPSWLQGLVATLRFGATRLSADAADGSRRAQTALRHDRSWCVNAFARPLLLSGPFWSCAQPAIIKLHRLRALGTQHPTSPCDPIA